MKILMIACSQNAYRLMQKLKEKWIGNVPDIDVICKTKCSSLPEYSMKQSVSECVAEYFAQVDAIVFLAAAGIAVRSIAPCIRHKSIDPAVLVIDETGKFCISLLSGHMGGANELAEQTADMIGAIPVITTATDREKKFAVDDYARRNDLAVTDWKLAKEISVSVLNGNQIGLCVDRNCVFNEDQLSEWNVDEDGITGKEEGCSKDIVNGVQISYLQTIQPVFPVTLQLVPRLFVVGIGCRKNTSEERIAKAIEQCLVQKNIHSKAICAIASIDIKAQETGILSYCEKNRLPFLTYSPEKLRLVEGNYSESDFVEQVTGVSNVCERSAMAAAKGELICKKQIYDGVTVAIARKGN